MAFELCSMVFELPEAGLTIPRGAVDDSFDRLRVEFQCVVRVILAGTE